MMKGEKIKMCVMENPSLPRLSNGCTVFLYYLASYFLGVEIFEKKSCRENQSTLLCSISF
jgi:hypothetical protein